MSRSSNYDWSAYQSCVFMDFWKRSPRRLATLATQMWTVPHQKRIDVIALMREIVEAAKESPRRLFAPLVGAIKAIRREMDHLTDGNLREPGSTSSRSATDDQR